MITSVRNPRIARTIKLKRRVARETEARFLVEGAQGVAEAIGAGLELLFHTEPSGRVVERALGEGIPAEQVSHDVMAKLTSTVTPQGLVGVAPFVDVPLDSLDPAAGCLAVLAAVRDPGNAGTVLRSADAAGAGGVVFCEGSVDVYNPKAVRAAAGSLFHLPVVRGPSPGETVDALRRRGFTVLAAVPDGDVDLYELALVPATAFLFGNEAWGLPEAVARLADGTVRVPIRGRAESLNLAAAASVVLIEWARQRRLEHRVALETLIAAAAHDLRSPLTAMKGFGYSLASRWATMGDEQREIMLQGILYDTERMDSIVKQLVDAARVAAGRLDLFPETTDVGEVVEAIGEAAGRDPEHPELVWHGGSLRAMIDPARLRTAIGAFVEAEVWWAREGPIEVTGEVTDGRLRIEVFRRGADLTPDEAEGLFAPRRPGAGAGSKIGLFVTRGIAQAQGGTATAEIEGGLRFRLDIPITAVPLS